MTRARSGCVSMPTLLPPGVKADCPASHWLLQRRMPRRACGVRPFWPRWCVPLTSPTEWIRATRTRALPPRLLKVCVGWCPLPGRPQRRHSCSPSGLGRRCRIELCRPLRQPVLPRSRPNPRLRPRRPPLTSWTHWRSPRRSRRSNCRAKTRARQKAADEGKKEREAADAERRAEAAGARADSALKEPFARVTAGSRPQLNRVEPQAGGKPINFRTRGAETSGETRRQSQTRLKAHQTANQTQRPAQTQNAAQSQTQATNRGSTARRTASRRHCPAAGVVGGWQAGRAAAKVAQEESVLNQDGTSREHSFAHRHTRVVDRVAHPEGARHSALAGCRRHVDDADDRA